MDNTTYIPRESEPYLISLLSTTKANRPVILLEGARQVGKTALAQRAITAAALKLGAKKIDCNLETDRVLRSDIDTCESFADFTTLLGSKFGFNPNEPTVLLIDEAQESQRLGSFVRSMKEEWPQVSTLLTGSSMTRLFPAEVRIPVGRIIRVLLSPFSFNEFLVARGQQSLLGLIHSFCRSKEISPLFHSKLLEELDRYLTVGGLPEVIRAFCQGEDFLTVRRSLLLNQEDDFLRKEGIAQQHLFRDALRGIATHVGTPSKLSHISEQTYAARKIINQLSAWHLSLDIEQRGTNISTSFHPKRYLYDLGITHDVRASPFPRLSVISTLSKVLRTDLGGLLENFVALQLSGHRLGQVQISSWKKNNNEPVEVDFVLNGDLPIPIECKAALKISQKSFQYVKTYLEIADLKVGFVASAAPYQEIRAAGRRLVNVPLYLCSAPIIQTLAAETHAF